MNRMIFGALLACLVMVGLSSALHADEPTGGNPVAWLDQYNVVWDSQSKNSGESMPCGGGDVCMNVWVEGGDILFYVQRPGAYDENGACLKAGRIRLRMDPNPFAAGGEFKQELKLRDGCVEISGRAGEASARVRLWADVRRPVVRVETTSEKPVQVSAWYEAWRTTPYAAHDFTWNDQPGLRPLTVADEIQKMAGAVEFHHRNPGAGLFDTLVRGQKLDSVKDQLWNPLKNLTSGGLLMGDGFVVTDGKQVVGKYAGIAYSGWELKSTEARTAHSLRLVLHTAQSATVEDWQAGLQARVKEVDAISRAEAWKQTEAWWHEFWNRSHIVIQPRGGGKSLQTSAAWQVGRNYQLFRYMLGCNAYGDAPTKFNGGFFTFDPPYVWLTPGSPGSPDFRGWGGSNHTGQNQRLVYWPMLKSGDGDMMRPQLEFYSRMTKNGELRSKSYWGHGGTVIGDQTECFALPSGGTYGWTDGARKRPPELEPGLTQCDLHQHYYSSEIEFAWMMLEYRRYTGTDIARYLPYIESVLTFFNEHYQFRCKQRTGQPFDQNGKLVIEPSKALETYEGCTNPTDVVTGLTVTLRGVLGLPDTLVSAGHKAIWREMLDRLPPPANYATVNGKRLLVPAEKYGRRRNGEIPQLYPLFPYGTHGIGKPHLDDAINCWLLGGPGVYNDKGYISWYQNGIFTARMGLRDEARYYAIAKLSDSGRRFPAFFGPGFDYCPDHNWGGSGMIGLQDMLLQESGDDLYLLPAWPEDWDVDFKLHAPRQSTVEGRFINGKLEDIKVAGDKKWAVHQPEFPAVSPAKPIQFAGSFEALNVPSVRSLNKPGIWQKAFFDASPVVENGAYKTAPQSLISYNFGRCIRGRVNVKIRAVPGATASGVLEILNDDVNANRTTEKSNYRGVMLGLNGQPTFQSFTLGEAEQFNGLAPEWRLVGSGLAFADGWAELTLDATKEGYVTIGVRDLASGRLETSRVKAVAFVNGFQFIRLGSYSTGGEPVWFKDLTVVETTTQKRQASK